MTSKLTREELLNIIETDHVQCGEASALARMALAAMDSEPVGEVIEVGDALLVEWHKNLEEGAKLYTTPQAPVIPFGLHLDTKKLVTEFCTALAEKLFKAQLKYGHSDNWSYANWEIECQTAFHEHIAKGDPRDVAAYCAFMWYHGWKTESAQPAPVVPTFDEWLEIRGSKPLGWVKDAMRESYDACRAAMLQAGTLTNEDTKQAWTGIPDIDNAINMLDRIDTLESCDDDRIEAVKTVLRRLAGNSPVIPDGLIAAVNRLLDSDGSRGCYSAIQCGDAHDEIERLLAAAPQEVK